MQNQKKDTGKGKSGKSHGKGLDCQNAVTIKLNTLIAQRKDKNNQLKQFKTWKYYLILRGGLPVAVRYTDFSS
jgi:hypothetical protein